MTETPLVVVDGRAASTDLVLDYFAEVSAFELLEGMGARPTVVMPVNHEADSVTQIKSNPYYTIIQVQDGLLPPEDEE